jgi:hypothetical protein
MNNKKISYLEYKNLSLEPLREALASYFGDRLKEDGSILPEEDEYEYIPCNCSCHTNSDIIHIAACCYNGYRKVKKNKVDGNRTD